MKIFQVWLVSNSCIFILLYCIAFLRLKYSNTKSIFLCMLAVIVSVLLEILRIQFAFDDIYFKLIVTSLNIAILQGSALLLSEQKNAYAIFIGFSSANFVLAGNILSCGALILFDNKAFAMAACSFANFIVFCLLVWKLRIICLHMLYKEVSLWTCLLPAFSYITFFLILYFPVSFEQHPESIFAALSLLITIIALYILLLRYIYFKSEEKELLQRNATLSAYISGIEIQTSNAETAVREFQIMRHDMRHKDQLLIELLHNRKYIEAEHILENDLNCLEEIHLFSYCEHVILNSILCGMTKRAEQMHTRLLISCAVPKQTNIEDYDLAMVAANLIDNALYAASQLEEKQRYVSFQAKTRNKERFFLEVQNPCKQIVKFSKKTGLPLSTRGAEHGYGLISVQNFVEKYHAQFDCYVENQIFIVRILIHFT